MGKITTFFFVLSLCLYHIILPVNRNQIVNAPNYVIYSTSPATVRPRMSLLSIMAHSVMGADLNGRRFADGTLTESQVPGRGLPTSLLGQPPGRQLRLTAHFLARRQGWTPCLPLAPCYVEGHSEKASLSSAYALSLTTAVCYTHPPTRLEPVRIPRRPYNNSLRLFLRSPSPSSHIIGTNTWQF